MRASRKLDDLSPVYGKMRSGCADVQTVKGGCWCRG